ncbi:MAG: WecB/TagA/CpsF family glycosyltransferase [Actinomycetota bacterium]
MSRIELFGFGVDAVTTEQALDWVAEQATGPGRGRILTLNATGMMIAEQDEFLARYAGTAELVVADGQPLVWASPLFGTRLPERVAGIDLVDRMAAQAADRGWPVFLLGAEEATIAEAARELERRHSGLKVAGHHHGFLGDSAAEVAAQIAASGASILFVGMGMPRQEQFIDGHWERLGVDVAIGVGGTFEVITGHLRRAPVLVQRLGLEWAFRMIQEPRRLAGRYGATLVWLLRRTAPAAGEHLLRRRR